MLFRRFLLNSSSCKSERKQIFILLKKLLFSESIKICLRTLYFWNSWTASKVLHFDLLLHTGSCPFFFIFLFEILVGFINISNFSPYLKIILLKKDFHFAKLCITELDQIELHQSGFFKMILGLPVLGRIPLSLISYFLLFSNKILFSILKKDISVFFNPNNKSKMWGAEPLKPTYGNTNPFMKDILKYCNHCGWLLWPIF